MKCACSVLIASLVLIGCGKKEPEKAAETKETVAAPAAVQAPAEAAPGETVTPQAIPKAAIVPEVRKTPVEQPPESKPSVASAPTAKNVVLTDAVIKNWGSALVELKKLFPEQDNGAAKGLVAAMAGAGAFNNAAQADALVQKHGLRDFPHFAAVTERLMVAYAYATMKKSLDEAVKDLSPDEKALMAGMMRANLEQSSKNITELGITEQELDTVTANVESLQEVFETKEE